MTASFNTWLYAVVPAHRQPPPELSGVAGEPLRTVVVGEIAAVVGSVPRSSFGEDTLQAHLEDAAWLEVTAVAHHRVIDALARTGPTLPMRFATLFRDDQRSAAMLRDRLNELSAALRQITDRVEWGVKVYVARPVATAPASGPSNQAGNGQRPGTAYLLRRKAQRENTLEALRGAMDDAQQIHASLAALTAASTQHPLQKKEASGRSEPMVLNGAYLVDDSRRPALEQALSTLAGRYPGLRIEVTGPWPPYSFSAIEAKAG